MRNTGKILLFTLVLVLAAAGGGVAEDQARFVVGPGDVMDISVYQDETLRRDVVVPPDGVIEYPLIGALNVTGMTVTEIRQAISKKMEAYIPDASVSVIYRKIASSWVSVVGKVNRPGIFGINQDSTVLQALSMAGGLNPFAKSDRLVILRRNGEQTEVFSFDYQSVSRGQKLEQNIVLQKGDVIVAP